MDFNWFQWLSTTSQWFWGTVSLFWPTKLTFTTEPGFRTRITGWDTMSQETIHYFLTSRHLEKALRVIPEKAQWIYTPQGYLYMLDRYLHEQPECTSGDRIISIFENGIPLQVPRTLMQCLNLEENIPRTKASWIHALALKDGDTKLEMVRGDMTIVELL